ncbi:remorin 1.4-like [Euphorbia lathyris]|uniref:remorin 1.4-like n=1 Tax=Euphorbia lathyris TaxID=212925 RepID=UPI003313FE5D
MNRDYNYQQTEFAAAVAAGTFVVYSLEESKAKFRRETSDNHKKTRTEIRIAKEDTRVPIMKHSSIKDAAGKIASQKPPADTMPSRKLSRLASRKSMLPADQRHSGRGNVVEDKVDSWEKAQIRKINKRYEKMKSEVVVWENAKKMQAKLSMERKRKELEMRKIRNMQHYQIKVDRIEAIAGGAKGQLEEKRRNDESEVREKAKHMRSKGKNPVRFFCC